jgi:hypothetical protein
MREGDGTFLALLDDLRCRDTSWLRDERDRVVVEQRRLRVRELAITRVLDERDALSAMPDGSVSTRTQRATVEVARALESLPAVADAAAAGEMSWEQLEPVSRLATPETDREWANRAPSSAPIDLNRLARRETNKVTAEDARARYQARRVRTWREVDHGMGAGHWLLPDLDGILVDKVLDHMAEQMKPAKGERWDSLEHRKADALVELCRTYADVEPTGAFKYQIVVHHRADGSADCDGLAVAPVTLDTLTADATLKDASNDDCNRPTRMSRARRALPRDVERYLIERDPHCRVPGCERNRRLQNHHLVPRSWGGGDFVHNLARVCPYHHRMLIPHGRWHLVGDPEQIDGLTLVNADDLIDARAGPAP